MSTGRRFSCGQDGRLVSCCISQSPVHEQFGQSLVLTRQVGGGPAEVFGVPGGCESVEGKAVQDKSPGEFSFTGGI